MVWAGEDILISHQADMVAYFMAPSVSLNPPVLTRDVRHQPSVWGTTILKAGDVGSFSLKHF